MSLFLLRRVAAAAGFGVMSGCATVAIPTGGDCVEGTAVVAPLNLGAVSSQKYNADCGVTRAGTEMVKSTDPGVKAVGIMTLEHSNPNIRSAADKVRAALVNTEREEYTLQKRPDGSYVLVGTPIVTVPKTAPAASAPAQPASAAPPAPAPQP